MGINLQNIFLLALGGVLTVFALLWVLKGRFGNGATAVVGDAARFVCLQALLAAAFLLCYVFCVKNGIDASPSDLSVGFLPLAIGIFWAAWRYGALSPDANRLWLPFAYSVFLLCRFFTVKGSFGFFNYVVYNIAFGFIGGGACRPLAAINALLPFACAAIGRGMAVKTIDKRNKI